MAIIQSTLITGMGRRLIGNGFRSGSPIVLRHTHSFAGAAVTTADILELFEWPAYARFQSFRTVSTGIGGTINVDIGAMTGTLGDTTGRAMGTPLLVDDGDVNTALTATLATLTAAGKNGDTPLGIGLVPASNITAGAKTLTFEAVFFFD